MINIFKLVVDMELNVPEIHVHILLFCLFVDISACIFLLFIYQVDYHSEIMEQWTDDIVLMVKRV